MPRIIDSIEFKPYNTLHYYFCMCGDGCADVSEGYAHVCLWVEARCFPLSYYTLIFRQCVSLNLKLDWQAHKPQELTALFPFSTGNQAFGIEPNFSCGFWEINMWPPGLPCKCIVHRHLSPSILYLFNQRRYWSLGKMCDLSKLTHLLNRRECFWMSLSSGIYTKN